MDQTWVRRSEIVTRHCESKGDLDQTWARLGSDFIQTLVRLWSDFGQTLVRLGLGIGQTLVRLGLDVGQTLGNLRSDFGQTEVRLGSDLGQTLVRLWSAFGQTLVRLWSDFGQDTWSNFFPNTSASAPDAALSHQLSYSLSAKTTPRLVSGSGKTVFYCFLVLFVLGAIGNV